MQRGRNQRHSLTNTQRPTSKSIRPNATQNVRPLQQRTRILFTIKHILPKKEYIQTSYGNIPIPSFHFFQLRCKQSKRTKSESQHKYRDGRGPVQTKCKGNGRQSRKPSTTYQPKNYQTLSRKHRALRKRTWKKQSQSTRLILNSGGNESPYSECTDDTNKTTSLNLGSTSSISNIKNHLSIKSNLFKVKLSQRST